MTALPGAKKRGRPDDPELVTRRQTQLLDVAGHAFAEHGYANTDVQLVADMAGVGKGTVYRYFENKEALFLAAVDDAMGRLNESLMAIAQHTSDPLEMMALAVHGYLRFFDQHPHCVELLIQERAFFRERTKPTYYQHMEANIGPWRVMLQSLIDEGRVRKLPVDRVTAVISDMLYGTMFTNYFARREISLQDQFRDILDLTIRGVFSETEAKTWDDARIDHLLKLVES